MIKAFRADDRLIHGQVQTQWISTYGVNRVMIIDSNVVRDPINVQILKLAKPAGIDLVICDEEKAMNLIAKDAAQPAARTFVIFKTIETACRMQNIDYAVSMAPILKKLYPDDNEKFSERLSSHMEFFNTQPTAGCLINGMVIAMEEEKAMGKDIPDEAITNLKSSMMGPLAGIGDSVMNSLIEVVLMSIAMTFAFQGNLFGPVFYLVTWVAASLIISWFLINRGYKLGINSLSVMSDSVMGRLVEALTQIGLMVIGGLSATYVAVSTPLVIAGSGGADDTVVQAILDNILPNLLPLGLVGLCYWLMTKKKCSPIVLILILFVLGTVLSVLGILG